MTRFIRTIWLCMAVAFSASIIGHGWAEAGHEAGHAAGWEEVALGHGHDDGSSHAHVHVPDLDADEGQADAEGDQHFSHHHGADGHAGLPVALSASDAFANPGRTSRWTADRLPPTLRGDGPDMPPRPTRI